MPGWAVLVLALTFVGLLVYVISAATRLKATAESLQHELSQFKEHGLDVLIREKLSTLTQEAQQRDHVIVQAQEQARTAAERFQQDLGIVKGELEQLRGLQVAVGELTGLLKPQQFRGALGEVIVKSILADKLATGQYEENYTFRDGSKVEFAIRFGDKMIPVDSKLPLDDFKRMQESVDDRERQACRSKFRRTLKKKIEEVREYVRPQEGTAPFAVLVIPSEAVYYDVVAHADYTEAGGLYDFARARNTFLASPNTFWALVTVIAHVLSRSEVGRRADEILARLEGMAGDIHDFYLGEFRLMGGHLKDAAKQYDNADQRLSGIAQGLASLQRLRPESLTEQGVKIDD